MDSFSWTDGFRATVSTCLPCFSNPNSTSDSEAENQDLSAPQRGSQSRYEELEGLLRDPDDTDGRDAEIMSLHSNLGVGDGQRRRKKKKRRNHRTIRLFGFHLFGRPPIQLSDSEDGDDGNSGNSSRRRRPGRLGIGHRGSAYSSSSAEAFDSDASPLDAAAISQLSPQDAAARASRAAEEREAEELRRHQERIEKEERRRRRRERKELERHAAAAVTTVGMDGEEFEGFPGSGSLRPPPLSPGPLSSAASPTLPKGFGSPVPADEFGPYVTSTATYRGNWGEDGEGEEADFGGEVYTRKASSRGRGSDSSRSHTHSQTSASRSNADSSSHYLPYAQLQQQVYFTQSSPLASPAPSTTVFAGQAGATGLQVQDRSQIPRHKKKSKRSSDTVTTVTATDSRSPTSQSASLPSLDSDSPRGTPEPLIVQNHDDEAFPITPRRDNSIDISLFPEDTNESKFPVVGFGGARRTNSSGSTATSGVFLARRGDD